MTKISNKHITIDLNQLIELKLTANQFVYLAVLYDQGYKVANILAKLNRQEKEYLISEDYIYEDLFGNIGMHDKSIKLFAGNEDFDTLFEELYKAFPRKVPDGGGGFRVLRADSLDSKDAKTCKKKYFDIIKGDVKLHKRILQALETEKRARKTSMQFMNNLETWLNQRVYEKYIGLEEGFEDTEKTEAI